MAYCYKFRSPPPDFCASCTIGWAGFLFFHLSALLFNEIVGRIDGRGVYGGEVFCGAVPGQIDFKENLDNGAVTQLEELWSGFSQFF